MARKRGPMGPKRRSKKKSRFREQAKCRFCRDKVDDIDYKETAILGKLLTQHGKMFSRKRSGNCALHQRMVKRAVKRARFIGLLPYVT